jgi:hypothetical protein
LSDHTRSPNETAKQNGKKTHKTSGDAQRDLVEKRAKAHSHHHRDVQSHEGRKISKTPTEPDDPRQTVTYTEAPPAYHIPGRPLPALFDPSTSHPDRTEDETGILLQFLEFRKKQFAELEQRHQQEALELRRQAELGPGQENG